MVTTCRTTCKDGWTNTQVIDWRSIKIRTQTLPEHLKYAYLDPSEILPIIIAPDQDQTQEEKLLAVLKENKEAIGWTLANIKGINPSIVQHQIHLEEEAKPIRDPQRRLNPAMKEVIKKEILKLLDNKIIYPISDSS